MLDKKLVHVVYSKSDKDVLVIAMPAERCVKYQVLIINVFDHASVIVTL